MSLAGPLKDFSLILTSVFIFNSPISPLQVVGFIITLIGLNLYREFKTDQERLRTSLGYVKEGMCWGISVVLSSFCSIFFSKRTEPPTLTGDDASNTVELEPFLNGRRL
jgi:hypothetical protein